MPNDRKETDAMVGGCVSQLLYADDQIQEVLLACTHYPLVESMFRAHLPKEIHVLNQSKIVAAILLSYLERHPELDSPLQKTGERKYFTTNGSDVSGLASIFYGNNIRFKKVRPLDRNGKKQ